MSETGPTTDRAQRLQAVGLAIYTVPSGADVRGALGIQDAQQEADN